MISPDPTADPKPCPWCGGTKIRTGYVPNTGGNIHFENCSQCGADGPRYNPNKVPKFEQWNRRAPQPEPAKEPASAETATPDRSIIEHPKTLAEWCYNELRSSDKLFEEIIRIMGGAPIDQCADAGYKWACADCWVDDYDASVEVIRGIDWPELTREQADEILSLGFGQIYESLANADTSTPTGILWTKTRRGWCHPRNKGDGNMRMVKAITERDMALARIRELEAALHHWLYVWDETDCEHDDVMPAVDETRKALNP